MLGHEKSIGSGVIVDPDGYIVTNAHVIKGAVTIRMVVAPAFLPGEPSDDPTNLRTVDAKIIGIDQEFNLALLKIEEKGLPALKFMNSDRLGQGDLVLAIGAPMGLRNSVSFGVVSSPDRSVGDDNPKVCIQTDASINPGNGGGALVTMTGLLAGLNVFIVSLARDHGVIVSDVVPESPADRAGLQRKDIILSLDGQKLVSAGQLRSDIYRRAAGEKLDLRVLRGQDELKIIPVVRERQDKASILERLIHPEENFVARLGVLCVEIDKEVAGMIPGLRREYCLIVAAKTAGRQSQSIDLQPRGYYRSCEQFAGRLVGYASINPQRDEAGRPCGPPD